MNGAARQPVGRIRAVRREELAACAALIRRSFMTVAEEFGITAANAPRFTAFATDEARLLHQLEAERRPMFVFEADGALLGYCSLSLGEDGACELSNLAVAPEHRHAGIGKALLDHAAAAALEAGHGRMRIGIVEENRWLRAWYERLGAVHTGTRKFDFFPFTCGYMEMDLTGREAAEGGTTSPAAPLTDRAGLQKQYGTADRLDVRIAIHDKYSVNRQGFGNWITSHYPIREGTAVLELGCGTGSMWQGRSDLIRRCDPLVLSDLSAGMLEKARETLRCEDGIEYRVIDIQDIPYPNGSFDLVIANMMLYHVPDLPRGLREVRRVLKAGGTFCCATFGEHGMVPYLHSLFGLMPPGEQGGFTLQNGEEKLRAAFPEVRRLLYEDALAVTDPEDLADYILSLGGMTELKDRPREALLAVLRENMRGGVLRVPKEYGMFIAR